MADPETTPASFALDTEADRRRRLRAALAVAWEERDAAVARAERAEAVVRLLLETGGDCWAERAGGGRCTKRAGHPEAHHRAGPYEWVDGGDHAPSPLAGSALAEITAGPEDCGDTR